MKVLRQVSSRNQITIPPKVLKKAGIRPGDHVQVVAEEKKIVLRPKEITDKSFSQDDWEKLEKLVKKQLRINDIREHDSIKKAKKYLDRLSE